VIVVIIIVVAAGAYFLSQGPASTTSSTSQSSTLTTTRSSSSSSSPSSSSTTTTTTTHPTTSTTTTTTQPTSSSTTTTTSSTTTTLPSSSTSTTSSSTTTSISSTTSSASFSSSTTTTTNSCTTSSTTTTTTTTISPPFAILSFAPLFGNYSGIAMVFHGSSSGSANTSQYSEYGVTYTSSTTYKVSVGSNITGAFVTSNAWVLKNGTILAFESASGQNSTGLAAEGLMYQNMLPFVIELEYSSLVPSLTSAAGAHVVSQMNTNIGPTTVSVTNYAANSLPLTVPTCSGTFTLSQFSVQTGTVQGKSLALVTMITISGTDASNGQTTTDNFYLQIRVIN
jgi:hypothetical protein